MNFFNGIVSFPMETFRVSDSITTNPTSRQLVLYKFTRFCISCLLIVAGGGGFGFLRHFLTVEKKEAREAVDPALEQWLENFRTGSNCFEKFVFWRYLSWYFCQIVATRTETGFYAGFEAVCIPFLTESRELDTIVTTRGPNTSHLTRTRGLLRSVSSSIESSAINRLILPVRGNCAPIAGPCLWLAVEGAFYLRAGTQKPPGSS